MPKTSPGRYFEDFSVGEVIQHATPRTLWGGDQSVYGALYGSRFALQSSDEFSKAVGFSRAPVDDCLAFHVVFGKTVADISLNAVANLGYAEGRFLRPVFPGDTLSARSEVIGIKENSNGKTGIVYVRTEGLNQRGDIVLTFVRWVMMRKRDENAPTPDIVVPDLEDSFASNSLKAPKDTDWSKGDLVLSGSRHKWGDYEVGEKIDHVDGVTVEEAEHQLATRLYQNSAKVHFNHHTEGKARFGRRLVYGGHVISLARAISFNGLANAWMIAAINGGTHAAPLFAGDTVYAWSEVLDAAEIDGRSDVGALRLRLVATKDTPCTDFPYKGEDGAYADGVILDFDYWALMPR